MVRARVINATVLGLALIAPGLAAGQESDDEIIVTGQRTARTLADTQASVAVVTAEQIETMGVESFRDAFRTMGNVIDADWVDAGFVIRGVNSEGLTPGGNPLASVYIDGAAQTIQGARRGARGLWDVQQVEVYRGPQSTLSGRASLAGAIYVQTRDPTFEWDLAARATLATLETQEAAIAFGGPLIADRLAFRISAEYQRDVSDLNYPDYAVYRRFNDFIEDEYYQIRGKLALAPRDARGWAASLSYSISHDSPAYDDIAGPGLGFAYSARRGDLNASLPFFQEAREADGQTISLEVTRQFSEGLAFTSLTTGAVTDLNVPSINEGTPGQTFVTRGFTDQTLITQEFRLNFDQGEEGLSWLAGVYLADDSNENERVRTVFFGGGRTDTSRDATDTFNAALFGELTWPVAPAFDVVLGGRVEHEQVESSQFFNRRPFSPLARQITQTGAGSDERTTFLPKAGLVWELGKDTNLGLTVQRGFRSGGVFINTVTGQPTSFDPESTWTYETSYRMPILSGRGRLAANVFYTEWSDQQVELQQVPGDPTSDAIVNAGASRLYGAEVEASARFTDATRGFVSLGLVDTRFEDFNTAAFGDLTGFEFPEAPDATFAFGFDYGRDLGFFAGFDARYVSDYLARDIQNAPADSVGDYAVLNLRAGWAFDQWRLTVFSDNALDEEYFVYQDVIGTFDCCATLGARRVTGVTVSYRR